MKNTPTDRYVASVFPHVKPGEVYHGWSECVDWCYKNIKNVEWRYVGEGVFEFKHEHDYIWFTLRWA